MLDAEHSIAARVKKLTESFTVASVSDVKGGGAGEVGKVTPDKEQFSEGVVDGPR